MDLYAVSFILVLVGVFNYYSWRSEEIRLDASAAGTWVTENPSSRSVAFGGAATVPPASSIPLW